MNTHWVSTLIRRRESASGASRRTPNSARRGTVLLMVLGVLALMAIIAVAYATLGRADRAESGSMVRKQRIEDQSTRIADYLAQTIADGTFATYVEPAYEAVPFVTTMPTGAAYPHFIVRQKAFDYPWTDRTMVSAPPAQTTAGQTPFDPTGSYTNPWDGVGANTRDIREAGSPFLAASEPTFVNWLQGTGEYTFAGRQPWYVLAQSWSHISNFSPNGNFVNLKNLRNNFDAAPGFKTDSAGKGRMSYGLTLFDQAGMPQFADAALGGGARVAFETNTPADPMVPAHWSSLQYRMFRPIVDSVHQPEDYEFLGNQYADADGDGMIDSRWFELKRFTELTVGTGEARGLLDLLPTSGRTRYFVAARAIDSTGLVNVNTATDEWRLDDQPAAGLVDAAPGFFGLGAGALNLDRFFPIGSTPADIDLRRILALEDVQREYGLAGGTLMTSEVLAALPQPTSTGAGATGNFSEYKASNASRIGLSAYLSLRGSFVNDRNVEGGETAYAQSAQVDSTKFNVFASSPLASIDRAFFYDDHGYSASEGRVSGTTALTLASPFDIGDEMELRAFAGVNDDRTVSRLEAVLGGRTGTAGAGTASGTRPQDLSLKTLGPLRESRPRSLELSFRDRPLVEGASDDALRATTGGTSFPSERALFAMSSDIRRLLTTFNGARPLVDSVVAAKAKASDAKVSVRTDVSSSLNTLRIPLDTTRAERDKVSAAVNVLFGLYADALMPYADQQTTAWKNTPDVESRGLSYGGSAELAMRMSAHLAVNAAEMVPKDDVPGKMKGLRGQPVALTLTVTQDQAKIVDPTTTVTDGFPWPRLRLEKRPKSALATDAVAPNQEYPRHASSTTVLANPGDDRVNVFGIAPHPFLTEVAVLAMYTDTPSGSRISGPDAGDTEPAGPPIGGVATPGPVTIDFTADLRNPDFLGELIAFQMHNPYDEEVVLFEKGKTALEGARFYIEIAGRRYLLAPQSPSGFSIDSSRAPEAYVLKPGHTRTFYALNPGTIEEFRNRLNHSLVGAPEVPTSPLTSDGAAEDFLNRQLQIKFPGGGSGEPPYLIPQVQSDTFATLQDPSPVMLGGNPMHAVDLWGTLALVASSAYTADEVGTADISASDPEQRQVASLWRVMRDNNSGDLSTTSINNPNNDLLVDRLRDPNASKSVSGTLFQSRSKWIGFPSAIDPGATMAGPDGDTPPDPAKFLDNSGFSAIYWASIGRPTDFAGTVGSGVFPAWCLEAKRDNDPLINSGTWSLNQSQEFNGASSAGTRSQFRGNSDGRFETLSKMVNSTSAVAEELTRPAFRRKSEEITTRTSGTTLPTTGNRTYTEAAIEYIAAARVPGSTPGEYLNSSLFTRPGDFLLPLCVGPEQYPNRATTGKRSSDLEAQWLTTSEALALSADFYSPPTGDINEALGRSGGGVVPKTDRGRLVLDQWTPYYAYGTTVPQDLRAIGSGVPFALGVMDTFRAALGVSKSAAGAANYRGSAFGSSLQSVPGVLNLNTAPLTNLRALPLVSPIASRTALKNSWLAKNPSAPSLSTVKGLKSLGTGYNNLKDASSGGDVQLFDPTSEIYDIAPTIASYRDKLPKRALPVAGSSFSSGASIDFSNSRAPGPAPFYNPRGSLLGIAGVREGRGIKSIGEVFMARYRASSTVPYLEDYSMNRYAVQGDGAGTPIAIQWPGLTTGTHWQLQSGSGEADTNATTRLTPTPAKTPRTYEQQLAILNALGNTATVRSDVFTVYFLVHGYTPEDVQVEDGQDMTPSVRKRFVMIVDRSNVVNKGDKPRIVTLKEVPVE